MRKLSVMPDNIRWGSALIGITGRGWGMWPVHARGRLYVLDLLT